MLYWCSIEKTLMLYCLEEILIHMLNKSFDLLNHFQKNNLTLVPQFRRLYITNIEIEIPGNIKQLLEKQQT